MDDDLRMPEPGQYVQTILTTHTNGPTVVINAAPRICSACGVAFTPDDNTVMTGHDVCGYFKPTGEYHFACLGYQPAASLPSQSQP